MRFSTSAADFWEENIIDLRRAEEVGIARFAVKMDDVLVTFFCVCLAHIFAYVRLYLNLNKF